MDNSGVNTIILVIILAVVIFGVVWFFKGEQQPEGVNVDVNLPASGVNEQE